MTSGNISVRLDQARAVLEGYRAAGPLHPNAGNVERTPSYWLGMLSAALSGLAEAVGDGEQGTPPAGTRQVPKRHPFIP